MSDRKMQYTRNHPSVRYRELQRMYAQMHGPDRGEDREGGSSVFQGFSLLPHAETIKGLIDRTDARSVLDYGAGKGLQYSLVAIELPDGRKFANVREYWGVERILCYDPGVADHCVMPSGQFDGVVCTDVLEHCPEEDLPWILQEIVDKAHRFVFATVAMYPASKTLPNGENAHCTLKPPEWWRELIARTTLSRPELSYRFELHWTYEDPAAVGQKVGPGPEIIDRFPDR